MSVAILALAVPLWYGSLVVGSMASAPSDTSAGRLCDTLSAPHNRVVGKKRRLERRSTEEAVERAITEHLGEQSVLTTSVMKVDGVSLKAPQLDYVSVMGLESGCDVRSWCYIF